MTRAFAVIRPLLHTIPPETVHNLGVFALTHGLYPPAPSIAYPELVTHVLGLSFANPMGLAAGFDKNAVAINGLLGQGFGFVEAGSVTPRPQPGNPKPRMFRLPEDQAVINRLGFNNHGLANFIKHYQQRNPLLGVAGANIGRNKDSQDAVSDYVTGLEALYPYADYVTVNISSPNTQGLRAMQQREALTELLSALKTTQSACEKQYQRKVPLLLKIAPDLEQDDLSDIAEVVLEQQMEGLIISNTTIQRSDLRSQSHTQEMGGLSGKPLFALSTERLKQMYRLTQGAIPLVGVGGISSAEDAYQKIRSGATLLQLYTAIVYNGFSVVQDINHGLCSLLKRDGFTSVQQAVGVDASC